MLSVDGFPLSIERVCTSVHSVVEEMEALIKKLTLSIDFSDAMAYIDSRTDPANPNNWFVDHPREDLQGTSLVFQDPKGLSSFSQRLLDRMALDGAYFTKSQGILVANKSKFAVAHSGAFLIFRQTKFGSGSRTLMSLCRPCTML